MKTKTRFDVSDRNPAIEPGQSAAERGRRVSLDENQIRRVGGQHRLEALQNPRCGLKEILSGKHDIEIVVRRDPKRGEYLIKQVTMLSRHADARMPLGSVLSKLQHDRAEFDRFGPCADDKENSHQGNVTVRREGVDRRRRTMRNVFMTVAPTRILLPPLLKS